MKLWLIKEDSMGWFGKKKEWDIARSDANKSRRRELFNRTVEDGNS